jgi:MFS family permease
MSEMATPNQVNSPVAPTERENMLLFWGCFLALVTTAFGFIGRIFLIETWATDFGLDPAQQGRLLGVGIWPFAVSIIGFSLIIDKVGYKLSVIFAFLGHIIWAIMSVAAYIIVSADGAGAAEKETAYSLIYWGSLIMALGNGTVEAFINPVIATLFNKEKVKWLNILHAGWPGGLVLAGILTIFMADMPWGYRVGIIAIPAFIYIAMLLPRQFPVSERVASGVTYKEMLSEFGIMGAAIVGFLVTLQLMDFASAGNTVPLSATETNIYIGIGIAIVLAFGIYTRSLGRPLMLVLVLIMMPLATTEIGTDGWITGIMEGVVKGAGENGLDLFHPGWVLVYTSLIMMILRFFAGPIGQKFSALGLLSISSILAIVGLYFLGGATSFLVIFFTATIYALGKTFFWPTMLGVVSEQMPKGGALTLNAISGIGMLAVGTLGFPFIGALQADKEIQAVVASDIGTRSGLVKDGKIVTLKEKNIYEIINYQVIDDKTLASSVATFQRGEETVTKDAALEEIKSIRGKSRQSALKNIVIFPVIMLVGYLALMIYFKGRGGYVAIDLDAGDGEAEPDGGGAYAAEDDGGGGDKAGETEPDDEPSPD